MRESSRLLREIANRSKASDPDSKRDALVNRVYNGGQEQVVAWSLLVNSLIELQSCAMS